MLFELMLIDSKELLNEDDFDIVLSMVKTYSKKPEASEEIYKILDLY